MYYRVRAELDYGPDEWDALPWWQQVMFTRQMEVAAAEQRTGEPETEGSFADDLAYRVQADELPAFASDSGILEGTSDNLATLGINVVRVQFGAEGR